jgi:hypothetical protein
MTTLRTPRGTPLASGDGSPGNLRSRSSLHSGLLEGTEPASATRHTDSPPARPRRPRAREHPLPRTGRRCEPTPMAARLRRRAPSVEYGHISCATERSPGGRPILAVPCACFTSRLTAATSRSRRTASPTGLPGAFVTESSSPRARARMPSRRRRVGCLWSRWTRSASPPTRAGSRAREGCSRAGTRTAARCRFRWFASRAVPAAGRSASPLWV